MAVTILATCDTLSPSAVGVDQAKVKIFIGTCSVNGTALTDTTLYVNGTYSLPVAVCSESSPIANARYRIETGDATIAQVVNDRTVKILKRGKVRLRARLLESSDTTIVAERDFLASARTAVMSTTNGKGPQSVNGSTVTMVALTDTAFFELSGRDSTGAESGNPIALAASDIAWSLTDSTIGSITSTGKLTSLKNGTTRVIGTIKDEKRADTITVVVSQRLKKYRITPDSILGVTLASIGADSGLSIAALDSLNQLILPANAPTPAWQSENPAIVTTTNAGRITAVANGSAFVRVSATNDAGSVISTAINVTVRQTATRISITNPAPVTLTSLGESVTLRSNAFDVRNVDLRTGAPTWIARDLTKLQVNTTTGVVTALAKGESYVVVRQDNATDSVKVVVTNTPRTIDVKPDSANLASLGDTVQFTATVRNALGGTISDTAVVWSAVDTGVIRVLADGRGVALAVGNTKVIGAVKNLGSVVDTAIMVVTNAPNFVDITLATATMASIGDSLTPAITLRNARGTDLSAQRGSVNWTSSNQNILTVSPTGVVVAIGKGQAIVRAQSPLNPAVADQITIDVTNAPEVVQLNRVRDTLRVVGGSLNYTAQVRNARGAILSGTDLNGFQWRSTSPQVATVDAATGVATAVADGETQIIGEIGSGSALRSATAALVVLNTVSSVTVSPSPVTVPSVGRTVTLAATAKNAGGGTISGASFTWVSRDPTIASVNASGIVTGVAAGSTKIVAKSSGITSDSVTVTVANAPATIDIVHPDTTITSIGDSFVPRTDIRTFSGSTLPNTTVDWTSGNNAVVTVSTDGTIIAIGLGTTTVRATNPIDATVTDVFNVTVVNAPFTVTVAPTPTSVTSLGQTQQFTATVKNKRGATLSGVPLTWSSDNNPVATVDNTGVATGVATGSANIKAEVTGTPAVFGTAAFTVANNVASVQVSPSSVTISGATRSQQLMPKAFNARGDSIPGVTASYSKLSESSVGVIASVTGGLVTGAKVGTGKVRVTMGSVVTDVNVTVDVGTVSGSGSTVALSTSSIPADGTTGATYSLTLRDSDGNKIGAGHAITVASTVSGSNFGTLSAVAFNTSDSTYRVTLTSTVVGAPTVVFTADGVSISSAVPALTVNPAAANKVVIMTQPSATAASSAVLGTMPVVKITDANGNTVTSDITTQVTANVTGATLGGTVTKTAVNGIVDFAASNLSLTGAPGSYTLTFTSNTGLTAATSNAIALSVGALNPATSTATASAAVAGYPTTITIRERDAAGNARTTNTGGTTVGVTVSGANSATPSATSNGDGTWTATYTPTNTGTDNIAITLNTTAISAPVTSIVAARTATKLSVTTQPSLAPNSGIPFSTQPAIQLVDATGLTVAQNNVVITASVEQGSATLGGTLTATTDASGVATFSNLVLTGPAGAVKLRFDAGSLTGVSSSTLALAGGSATQLSIITPPSTTVQNDAVLSQQPSIQLRDVNGNVSPTAGVVISAAITSGGGTLSGTTTATTNSSGIATFAGLKITGTLGLRTITFSGPSLVSAQATVDVNAPAAASKIGFTTTPSSSVSSAANFSQQPVIQVQDLSGNAVSGVATNVTASLNGSGALGGTTTIAANGSGTATFADLQITSAPGTKTITFTPSAAGLTAVTSGSISVGVGSMVPGSSTGSVGAGTSGALTTITVQERDLVGTARTACSSSTLAGSVSGANTVASISFSCSNGVWTGSYTPSIAGTDNIAVTADTGTGPTAIVGSPFSSTVVAGAASQLAMGTQPTAPATNGGALAQQPTVLIKDAAGNTRTSDNVTQVTASISTNGVLGGTTTVTANNGVATFTNLTAAGPGGSRTLSFSSNGLTGIGSNSFVVPAGAASQLSMVTQPSSSVSNGGTLGTQPAVRLLDAGGNNVLLAGEVITVSIGGGSGTLLGSSFTATTDGSGIATFSGLGLSGIAGAVTLQFSRAGLSSVMSAPISITAGAATQLTVTTAPSTTATNDVALSQQPAIQLRDVDGNALSTNGTVVTATISAGGGTLGGTTTATTVNGLATFTNLKITGTLGVRTLTFSASGLATASATVNVNTAGAAAKLGVSSQPTTAVNRATAGTVTVEVQDLSGNAVTTGGSVNVDVAASTGGLTGTTTKATVAGVATFNDLVLSGTIGNRQLNFTSTGLTGTSSTNITLTPGALSAAQSSATVPTTGTASVATTITVQEKDADGNARTASTGGATVAAAITGANSAAAGVTNNNNGTYTLTYTPTTVGTDNVAVTINGTGVIQSSPTSVVSAGAPTQLVVTAIDGSATNGVAFNATVQLRDANNNVVTTPAVTVSAAIATGNPALSGTTSVTTVNGIATFTNLIISGAGGNRTLTFSTSTLQSISSATSGTVSVSAGVASAMTMITPPPATLQSGASFGGNVVVQVVDAGGQAVTTAGIPILVSIGSGSATIEGTTVQTTDGTGRATFNDLGLSGPAGAVTLRFTRQSGSPSLTALTSDPINVTAAAASKVTIVTQPGTSTAVDATMSPIPVVRLLDAYNSTVRTAGVNITATVSGGSGTILGATTVATDANGIATFNNLKMRGLLAACPCTISFAAAGLSNATTGSISLTPGATDHFAVTNPGTLTALTPATLTLEARDVSDNVATSFTGTVNVSSNGTLSAGSGATAAFSSGTLGTHSVTFATGATNRTITVTRSGGTETGTSTTFTVNNPNPTLASASPSTASRLSSQTVTFTGTGFIQGVTTISTAATGVTVGATTVTNSTTATATVTIAAGATTGATSFTVTNAAPGGGTQSTAVITIDNPSATLASASPSTLERLSSQTVTFTGTNFISGVTTISSPVAGVTVGATTVTSSTTATATVTISGTAATGSTNFTATNAAPGGGAQTTAVASITNPSPTLASASPSTVDRLSSQTVTFTGTNFIQGVTTISTAVSGITVGATTVTSSTTATATVTVSGAATLGSASFTATNTTPGGGTQSTAVLSIQNPSPTVTSTDVSTGDRLASNLVLHLTGTNFVTGSTVTFRQTGATDAGITVVSATPNAAGTDLTVTINIAASALTGAHDIRVVNGAPGGGTADLAASFTVNNPSPTLASASPSTVTRLSSQTVTFTGTKFIQGVTTISTAVSGITVGATTVTSPTTATATVTLDETVATGSASFTVTNAAPGGGTQTTAVLTVENPGPTLSTPNSGAQVSGDRGETLNVPLTGSNFIQGVTSANFGSNITVNSVTVNSTTSATANITVGATATLGARTISISNATPGGGSSSQTNAFVVNNASPTLTSPNSGAPVSGDRGETLNVPLVGTNFVNGVTTANFGANITVNSVTVTDANNATANITVGTTAALGARSITVSNGGNGSDTQANAFVVNNEAPTLTAPNSGATVSGDRGETLNVPLTGTKFINGVTAANFGADITVNSVTVNSATSATANISVGATAALGARSITINNGGNGSSTQAGAFIVNNAAPTLATPNSGAKATGNRLDANLVVPITGTNFINGVTTANFGAGITVNSVTVNSATTADVDITITAAAATGDRAITVSNGGNGSGTQANAFTVENPSPTLASASPSTVTRLSSQTVTFTGTKFIQGVTTISTAVSGITVGATTVTSPTTATATVTLDETVPTGSASFTVTNAGPGGGTQTTAVITVENPSPTVTTPNSGAQLSADRGETRDIAVVGTGFIQGVTSADFGPDVTVNSVTVNSATSATVSVTVGAAAALGQRDIAITNATPGGGTVTKTNAFVVNNAPPTLSAPNSGAQVSGDRGETLDVPLVGTNFINGVTTASFGANITVNSVTVNTATSATANVTVGATAALGARSVSVNNGGNGSASQANAFVVNNEAPTLTTPNSGATVSGDRGETLNVPLTGTKFINGVTAANFGANITVNSVTVNSATSATANITVDASAALGARSITINNGGNGSSTQAGAFIVNEVAPTLSAPNSGATVSGDRGETLNVPLVGTNFINGTTTANFGANITVNSVTVTTATDATANITVGATASLGARAITVSNGGNGSGTQAGAFVVNNAAPTLVTPNSGAKATGTRLDQNLIVPITGTNFINGTTTANFGAGITVNSVTVTSATAANVDITISGSAALGDRSITVSNGGNGVGTQANAFTVENPSPTVASTDVSTGNRLASNLVLHLTGTGFVTGSTVTFRQTGATDAGITVVSATPNAAGTDLTVTINIDASALMGAHDIRVVNGAPGGGMAEITAAFTVENPSPTLDATLSPDNVTLGGTDQTIDIDVTGTGFIQGVTTAAFQAATGITVNSVTVNSPTSAKINVTFTQATVATGANALRVSNPAPGGGNSAFQTFTINP